MIVEQLKYTEIASSFISNLSRIKPDFRDDRVKLKSDTLSLMRMAYTLRSIYLILFFLTLNIIKISCFINSNLKSLIHLPLDRKLNFQCNSDNRGETNALIRNNLQENKKETTHFFLSVLVQTLIYVYN